MSGPTPEPPDAVIIARMLLHPDHSVTSNDLMPYVEKTKQALNDQLERLERDGYIAGKRTGSAARVYWVTERGRDYVFNKNLSVTLDSANGS